jgi:hypothetical protein
MCNCQPSIQPDCNQDTSIPIPVPLPPCPEGESCDEVTDAHCVIYTGPDQDSIKVKSGDKLDGIIQKWGQNHLTQAIATKNTNDISFSGNGQNLTPLEASVNLDPDTHNLISKTGKGLISLVNLCLIQDFASIVTSNPEAHKLFCDLISSCTAGYCGSATDLVVTYIETVLRATWVPFTDNSVGQVVQYKKLSETQWTSLSTIGAFKNTVDIPGVTPNTVYEVRIQTNCYFGGPSYNIPNSTNTVYCQIPTILASYDNISYSFKYVANDYTKLQVSLTRVFDGYTIATHPFDLAADPKEEIAGSFFGLTPLTAYNLTITHITPLGTEYTKICSGQIVTTIALPTCNIPIGLSATFE